MKSGSSASCSSKRGRQRADDPKRTWCRRAFSMPNPIVAQRDKSPRLPRCRDFGPCDICRNVKRKLNGDMTDKNFTASLKNDEKHSEFMTQVQVYEAHKNGTPLDEVEGYVRPGDADNDTVINVDSTSHLVYTSHVANFWPKDCYEEHFKQPVDEAKLRKGHNAFGDECMGVIRHAGDDPIETPRQVAKIMKEQKCGVSKIETKDRSQDHIFEGEGERAFEQARRRVDISFQSGATAENDRELSTKILGDGGDDESDDDFSALASLGFDDKKVHRTQPDPPAPSPKKGRGQTLKRERDSDVPKGSPQKKVPKAKAKQGRSAKAKAKAATWQDRQKAAREMRCADKTLTSIAGVVRQFNEDPESVSLAEAAGLEKKLEGRLDVSMRWVYTGEDLGDEALDDFTLRAAVLSRLQLEGILISNVVTVMKCSVAIE